MSGQSWDGAQLAFKPQPDSAGGTNGLARTTTIAVTTGGAGTDNNLPARDDGYNELELQNGGTDTVYVNVGPAGVTMPAVSTGYPVLPGQRKVITIGREVTSVKAIVQTTGGNLFATLGQGLG